jgi:cell division protein ZapA (FtsZ GTPase activity inhibitor)
VSLNVFNVDLIGPTFTIQTDESLDYMQSLVMRLRERLSSLKESTRVSDPLRLSVLLNITLMDELQRAKERGLEGGIDVAPGPGDEEFASIAARLIASLDRSLEAPAASASGAVLVPDAPDRIE